LCKNCLDVFFCEGNEGKFGLETLFSRKKSLQVRPQASLTSLPSVKFRFFALVTAEFHRIAALPWAKSRLLKAALNRDFEQENKKA